MVIHFFIYPPLNLFLLKLSFNFCCLASSMSHCLILYSEYKNKQKPPIDFEKRVKAIGYLNYIRYRIKFFILMWKIKWS